jgi:hypothetical protein
VVPFDLGVTGSEHIVSGTTIRRGIDAPLYRVRVDARERSITTRFSVFAGGI